MNELNKLGIAVALPILFLFTLILMPKENPFVSLIWVIIFIVLILNIFVQAYIQGKKIDKKDKSFGKSLNKILKERLKYMGGYYLARIIVIIILLLIFKTKLSNTLKINPVLIIVIGIGLYLLFEFIYHKFRKPKIPKTKSKP